MTAIDTLRKAAKDSENFDKDRARSDIEAATDKYKTASRYSVFHEDQLRPRDAVNFKRETMGLRPITDEEWDKLDEDGPAMAAVTHLKHLPNVGTITFTPLLPGEKGKPEVSQVAAE